MQFEYPIWFQCTEAHFDCIKGGVTLEEVSLFPNMKPNRFFFSFNSLIRAAFNSLFILTLKLWGGGGAAGPKEQPITQRSHEDVF